MKRTLCLMLAAVLSALFLITCNVHEWPDERDSADLRLNLIYSTDWDMLEVPFQTRVPTKAMDVEVRYIVRAYPRTGSNRQEHVYEQRFTRSTAEGYDCSVDVTLPVGDYKIMVWSDFVLSGSNDHLHYNPELFNGILLISGDEHPANTDYRDAFRGTAEVLLESSFEVKPAVEVDIEMVRPLCKLQIIATDLAEFIDKETKALSKVTTSVNGVLTPTKVDINDYTVKMYYTGYMPCAYNMFTDKPSDSKTGVYFESKITELNEQEASLGFDYLFINGTGSSTTVQLEVSSKDDKRVALSQPIEIPLKRNQHTLLIGKFLSTEAGGGIALNPEFAGDINLILP